MQQATRHGTDVPSWHRCAMCNELEAGQSAHFSYVCSLPEVKVAFSEIRAMEHLSAGVRSGSAQRLQQVPQERAVRPAICPHSELAASGIEQEMTLGKYGTQRSVKCGSGQRVS